MIRIAEVVLGLILTYFGLQGVSVSTGLKTLAYGLIALAGLALAIHGVLLFNVPDFFAGGM